MSAHGARRWAHSMATVHVATEARHNSLETTSVPDSSAILNTSADEFSRAQRWLRARSKRVSERVRRVKIEVRVFCRKLVNRQTKRSIPTSSASGPLPNSELRDSKAPPYAAAACMSLDTSSAVSQCTESAPPPYISRAPSISITKVASEQRSSKNQISPNTQAPSHTCDAKTQREANSASQVFYQTKKEARTRMNFSQYKGSRRTRPVAENSTNSRYSASTAYGGYKGAAPANSRSIPRYNSYSSYRSESHRSGQRSWSSSSQSHTRASHAPCEHQYPPSRAPSTDIDNRRRRCNSEKLGIASIVGVAVLAVCLL